MLRIAKQTARRPDEVLTAAAQFFGPKGVELTVSHRASDHISLEGGGGFVSVTVAGSDHQTEVTAVTMEWEPDVRQFVGTL